MNETPRERWRRESREARIGRREEEADRREENLTAVDRLYEWMDRNAWEVAYAYNY